MTEGIDISTHNGIIDWKKLKASGKAGFVIIRGGYEYTVDAKFKRNVEGALAQGIPTGVYWFSYACNVSQAKKEVATLLTTIKPYQGKLLYPICFDWEYASYNNAKAKGYSVTKNSISNIMAAALTDIENAGYYALNYMSKDFWTNRVNQTTLKPFDSWIAAYNTGTKKPVENCGIWQYSESGIVSGNGTGAKMDLDRSYHDYPSLITKKNLFGNK